MGRRLIFIVAAALAVAPAPSFRTALAEPPSLAEPPPVSAPAQPIAGEPPSLPPSFEAPPGNDAPAAEGEPGNRAAVPLSPGHAAAEPSPGVKLDPEVQRAQNSVASGMAGGAVGGSSDAAPFVLPQEKLALGKQTVGLSVEVIGPPTVNVNQETTLKIVVKNSGTTDAMGVVVRDELSEGVVVNSSQPPEQRISESLLSWNLGTILAGSEQTIVLKVTPTKVGPLDHSATVRIAAGSKSRTQVRQPRLKVEQLATSAKVLKGRPVQFKISITNTGDGPARDVMVRAKLSAGLRADIGTPSDEKQFEQDFGSIASGERVELEPLVADTVLAGEQSCQVEVTSPDVTPKQEGSQHTQVVTIIEPQLTMKLTGPDKRYTDTDAPYTVTLANPGTAPAKNVKVLIKLPISGRLRGTLPPNVKVQDGSKSLLWTLPQLDTGDANKSSFTFTVRVGGPGIYPLSSEAKADGGLFDKGMVSTDVIGLADIEMDVTERRRVIDVGARTIYQININNIGTKEATRLLVKAKLSDNLVATQAQTGIDSAQEPMMNKATGEIVFPMIERLPAGKQLTLAIEVQASKPGLATCRVSVTHDELDGSEQLEGIASTRVTAIRRTGP